MTAYCGNFALTIPPVAPTRLKRSVSVLLCFPYEAHALARKLWLTTSFAGLAG